MGTFLEKLQEARREMRAYGEEVVDVAAKQLALLALDPRVAPSRPPSPAGGGDNRQPLARADEAPGGLRVAALPPGNQPTSLFGSGPQAPAPAAAPGGSGLALDYAKLGLPGTPGSLWTDPRDGRQYILGPYGFPNFAQGRSGGYRILPPGTTSTGGPPRGGGGAPESPVGDVLPPGFVRDKNGKVVPAPVGLPTTTKGNSENAPPEGPTPGDQLLAGKLDRLIGTVRDGRPPAISRGEALVAAKMDKLISAVRDSGRFDLRPPL